MADATVTYEVKGTSDVQEQTDKAKKSMGQMENAVEGLNKKMANWGRDLILSYVAPMILLNKAIHYIAQSIEKQRQAAADAMDFTRRGESNQIDPGFQRQAQMKFDRENAAADKEKTALGRQQGALDFLKNATSEDMDRLFKRLGPGSQLMYGAGRLVTGIEGFSTDESIQNAVRDIRRADVMRDEEASAKAVAAGGINTMEVQNAVFGMGTSPIIASMEQQLDVQRQQADTLRRIEERLPARSEDYTKNESGTPYRPTITFR
jgi:hypothetical protein